MRQLLLLGGLAGLVLGWNMPNHYPLWTSFHGELAAVVALSLLFGGLSWPASTTAATTRVAFGLSTSARLWLVLAAIPVLQYAAGMLAFRGDAALGLLYGLGVVLALHVGRMWVAQRCSFWLVSMMCRRVCTKQPGSMARVFGKHFLRLRCR